MSSANCPDRLHSLLSWTHCLRGSLQPEGSFDRCDTNSDRFSGTEWSATEIVRSRFLNGCRERSLLSLWKHYITWWSGWSWLLAQCSNFSHAEWRRFSRDSMPAKNGQKLTRVGLMHPLMVQRASLQGVFSLLACEDWFQTGSSI